MMGVSADTTFWVLALALAILFTLVTLFLVAWWGWREGELWEGESPYTGIPLRRAKTLSYFAAERTLLFMDSFQQYDNRIFKLSGAAFCRETGRIFTNCISWTGRVKVDWDFIQKRYPGSYVSWGSLNAAQQMAVRKAHDSLEGFQTECSSPTPAPRAIEPEYVFVKPGPLYVDLEQKVLVGWKLVPDTELEVLIVQKPKARIL